MFHLYCSNFLQREYLAGGGVYVYLGLGALDSGIMYHISSTFPYALYFLQKKFLYLY